MKRQAGWLCLDICIYLALDLGYNVASNNERWFEEVCRFIAGKMNIMKDKGVVVTGDAGFIDSKFPGLSVEEIKKRYQRGFLRRSSNDFYGKS